MDENPFFSLFSLPSSSPSSCLLSCLPWVRHYSLASIPNFISLSSNSFIINTQSIYCTTDQKTEFVAEVFLISIRELSWKNKISSVTYLVFQEDRFYSPWGLSKRVVLCVSVRVCMFRVLPDFYMFFWSNWGKMVFHNHDWHFPEKDDVEQFQMFIGWVYFLLCKMSFHSHFTDEKTSV